VCERVDEIMTSVRVGAEVLGSDGQTFGTVIAVRGSHIMVEKGVFYPTTYFVPGSEIDLLDGSRVVLGITRYEAMQSGWDVMPPGIERGTFSETDRPVIPAGYDDVVIAGPAAESVGVDRAGCAGSGT
jgi:hypothetical protein